MVSSNASTRLDVFLAQLAAAPAVLVQVDATQGSAPREAGSWMAVFAGNVVGTIGGGHLEYQAIARAKALLGAANSDASAAPDLMRVALGPTLGQCCGGVVRLRFERLTSDNLPEIGKRLRQLLQRAMAPVALFGGGHVGHALVRVLSSLPFSVHWIDSRDGVFPDDVPAGVVCEHSDPVQSAVASLAPQSRVLIMSFSHAEDLDIVAACLQRQRQQSDLPYIGLIGSQTKWASFRQRLAARGLGDADLSHVTCPIGVPGVKGKEPEVIAVAVAAQLLQTL
jgi:xanthine dehydrogenase accessory factor